MVFSSGFHPASHGSTVFLVLPQIGVAATEMVTEMVSEWATEMVSGMIQEARK